MEETKTKYTIGNDIVRLIFSNIEMANAYSTGLHSEFRIPNHHKAYLTWKQISFLIKPDLNMKQKKELVRLRKELAKRNRKPNPKYHDEHDYMREEPKYIYRTDKYYGKISQPFICYVNRLISELGMGIKDLNEE